MVKPSGQPRTGHVQAMSGAAGLDSRLVLAAGDLLAQLGTIEVSAHLVWQLGRDVHIERIRITCVSNAIRSRATSSAWSSRLAWERAAGTCGTPISHHRPVRPRSTSTR